MANIIKSVSIGKRKPGRPFNTTRYPWRSTAIGRSFYLRPGKEYSRKMMTKLRKEGFIYQAVETERGYMMVRVD